jgi:hypothetical protein
MRFIGALLVAVGTVATPFAHARGEAPAAAAVRGYFQSLARQDFSGAIARTDGTALQCTARMVNKLKSEAARHNAKVEVKVTKVDVREPGAPEARGVPVPVQFHIDVVGKKWCFSKVARRLDGQARFWVDPKNPDRIVAIDGNLE